MSCLSLVWGLTKFFLVCLIITLLPGIPPHADFKPYDVVRPQGLDPQFLEKKYLDKAEHIFEGELTGPEAFASYNGAIYTGIHGGFVVKVGEEGLTPVVKFGQDCEDISEEHLCGRPLGMKFDAAGNLYVVDAYYGVFKYNIQKGEKTLLVDVNEEIEGKTSKFMNDLAVAKDGTVYITVSSTTFPLNEGLHAILAAGDGRIIKYDPQSKKASVLAEGLLCPNGIALSSNEDYLVFAESVGARVMRYDLKGVKRGTISVFAQGLPGLPDNIRVDGQGGFYVSLVVPADNTHPALPVVLGPFPYIRKFLSRILYLVEFPFVQINNFYPNLFCRQVAHKIGHLVTVSGMSEGVNILHLDPEGRIIDALVGRDGSVNHVSDLIVSGDYILLGSPYNNFIGRVPRPNLPHQIHVKSVRYEEANSEEKRDENTAKKVSEAQAKIAAEAERVRKASEEEALLKAAEEDSRRAAEKAARRKKEAEAAARKAAEESKARLAAEEAKKRAAEEVKARKNAEESARKAAEEVKARKAAEEAKARKAAEESARRAAEEAKAKKLAEEAKARKLSDEAKARKAAEDIKLKKASEETMKRKAAEEAKANRVPGDTVKN